MLLFWMLLVPPDSPRLWPQVLDSLERSGRPVEITETLRERLKPPPLAPGAPPLVSFRFLEGSRRHRFGELGLVMDDAGH